MAGEDIIHMSLKELKRLKVIQEVIERGITQKSAALIIGLSERQVRRLVGVVRAEGERGIAAYHMMSAGSIVAAIPPVFMFFLMQKHFIAGLTLGAVK